MGFDLFTGLSPDPAAVKTRRKRLRAKKRCMEAYGPDGVARCSQCGTEEVGNLALETTTEEARAKKQASGVTGGAPFYALLRQAGYPPGFAVVCKSCQGIQANYGNPKNPWLENRAEDPPIN